MADSPTPEMLAAFKMRYRDAQVISYDHDEFLSLLFMAAIDINKRRPSARVSSLRLPEILPDG